MNYTIIEDSFGTEHVVIENADGGFTTMQKSFWDELEAQREQNGTL